MNDFKKKVLLAFHKERLFTPHAMYQMNLPERLITKEEVKQVILNGEIIEEYPDDIRGHSCLMMASLDTERIIHVVCSPKTEYLTIISAYIPIPEKWEADWKTRKTVQER